MEIFGVWDWFWLILLFCIPLVNLAVFIFYTCGYGNKNVVNLCRALLLWFSIGIALSLALSIVSAVLGV
ncbi:MAG: hypothetical protein AAFU71_03835 [Cyanobacteria bacterium J06632_22]